MEKCFALQSISKLDRVEFDKKISSQGLQKDREDLLFGFIKGDIFVGYSCRPDIEAYAIKCLMPEFYASISNERHPYSDTELYEYDPAKNGQNIIKHGIGFGEVVSYSPNFGTLMVPISDKMDGERVAIFSDLRLKKGEVNLVMAPPGIKDENLTISVASQRNGKFRFISARLLSSKPKKYKETVAQVLGEIIQDQQRRLDFIDRCVEIIERDLMK